MFDHTLGYRNQCGYGTQMQNKFFKNNIDSYQLYKKLLGFQYRMNESVVPIYTKKMDENKLRDGTIGDDKFITEMTISNLCGLNFEYLFHAIAPCEKNANNVMSNMIRPIYESIPKMFYLLRHPEDINIILCKESFNNLLPKQKYHDIQNSKKSTLREYFTKFLKTNGKHFVSHIPTTDDFFKNFNHSYNAAWYRNQIYTHESLNLQNVCYSSLSISSHANIGRTVLYDTPNPFADNAMEILTHLTFFNLFLYVNSCWEILEQLNEHADTQRFVMETYQELKSSLEMTYLYPDKSEYLENLVIKPDVRNKQRDVIQNHDK